MSFAFEDDSGISLFSITPLQSTMYSEPKAGVGVSHDERRESHSTTDIRLVQNVALADATAKAGVSPWTRAMFRVRPST